MDVTVCRFAENRFLRVVIGIQKMLLQRTFWVVLVFITGLAAANVHPVESRPHRILLDTDVDTDDFFALLYMLKLNRSEFELEVRNFTVLNHDCPLQKRFSDSSYHLWHRQLLSMQMHGLMQGML